MKKVSDRDLGEMTKSQLIDMLKWYRRVVSSPSMEKSSHKGRASRALTLEMIKEEPGPMPQPVPVLITELQNSLKGSTVSFEVLLRDAGQDPLKQLTDTEEESSSFSRNTCWKLRGLSSTRPLRLRS